MLSPDKELEVIELIAQGYTNREAGEVLGVKERSVKNYLYPIYKRLGVSNRVELTLWHVAHKQQTGD